MRSEQNGRRGKRRKSVDGVKVMIIHYVNFLGYQSPPYSHVYNYPLFFSETK